MKRTVWIMISGLFILCIGTLWGARAEAASGSVYSCRINPCYRHPVTGVIEDSGGESAYATGQGMVEGVLGSTGMLEVTDGGKYYLTFRMGLIDYTSDQQFQVQQSGDAKWQSAASGVTQNGSDENGTTADICIEVPSEDCIIRGTMYVEPMGREVIYYFYPSDYENGGPSDMKATIVTESSLERKEQSADASQADETGSNDNSQTAYSDTGEEQGGTAVNQTDGTGNSQAGNTDGGNGTDTADATNSSGQVHTAESTTDSGTGISKAAGLSLSTAAGTAGSTGMGEQDGVLAAYTGYEERTVTAGLGQNGFSVGQWILILTCSLTVSGLILLGAAAGIVAYFLNNRWKWFDDDKED